jgi:uncharacterized Fe-S cluster-containing radical SAM superfamily enzyme
VAQTIVLCRLRLAGNKGNHMDLRMFYQKLRKVEQEIADPHVVVVSHETPDGGRAGQKSEVSRHIAAKLVVEGKARLATLEEGAEFRGVIDHARQEAEQRALAQKIQVNVVSEADFRAIKTTPARVEKK